MSGWVVNRKLVGSADGWSFRDWIDFWKGLPNDLPEKLLRTNYKVLHGLLLCTAKYNTVLHAQYYSVLCSTTPYYLVLFRNTKYWAVLLPTTKYYSVLQSTTRYCTVWQSTHSTTKYDNVLLIPLGISCIKSGSLGSKKPIVLYRGYPPLWGHRGWENDSVQPISGAISNLGVLKMYLSSFVWHDIVLLGGHWFIQMPWPKQFSKNKLGSKKVTKSWFCTGTTWGEIEMDTSPAFDTQILSYQATRLSFPFWRTVTSKGPESTLPDCCLKLQV